MQLVLRNNNKYPKFRRTTCDELSFGLAQSVEYRDLIPYQQNIPI
jgi:hypothetical protein